MSTAPTPQPIVPEDRDAVLAFIAAQQADPATACAYVGMREEGLETDLDELDQPWTRTVRVLRDAGGAVTGAALVEWEEEMVGRAWVYGPWTTPETWDRDAPALLAAVVEQAPVGRHQVFAALANTRLAALAEAEGWTPDSVTIQFAADRAALARPDPAVRPAAPDDLPALTALHAAAFPDTYATAPQLLDLDSEYTVLVLFDDAGGGLAGYVAGRPDESDAYLDFVAVAPEGRRTGAGSRLVRAFADALPGDRVRLTCDSTQTAAVALHERLGFERVGQTRAWDRRS